MTFLGLDLPTWWFLVIGALVTGYGVLDGFDLGAGALHLFFRKEQSRRIALNAIGPIWDGNEVWLVIAGGALFAAFPLMYGTLLSAFYGPFMLFLVALIFRAIAIEFRSKETMAWWRATWDVAYCLSSAGIALLLGLMLGNLVRGIPLDKNHEFVGSLADFLNPYALLIALTTLSLFALHGAMFLAMKTEDRLFTRLTILVNQCSKVFILCFITASMATLIYVPHMAERFKQFPELFALPLAAVLIVLNVRRSVERRQYRLAFVSSGVITSLLLILVAVGLYPNLLLSSLDPAFSVTIHNAAASDPTLLRMLGFVAVGLPIVATYTVFTFWTFRGKVKMDEHSY